MSDLFTAKEIGVSLGLWIVGAILTVAVWTGIVAAILWLLRAFGVIG